MRPKIAAHITVVDAACHWSDALPVHDLAARANHRPDCKCCEDNDAGRGQALD